jgi:hypothetical protein
VTPVSGSETTITATANGGGCKASCEISVKAVGIFDARRDQIGIYPNPVYDLRSIQTGITESHQVELSSLNGKIIKL